MTVFDRKSHIRRWCARIAFGIFLILFISKWDVVLYAEDGVIIANAAIPVKQLSKKEITKLYLGRKKIWRNGENVIIAWLDPSDYCAEFLKEYVSKTPRQFKNYWKNMLFMGKTHIMPESFDDEASLIRFVSQNKGAIGYVSSSKFSATPSENVKVISIK